MLLISSPFLALTYFLICFSLFRPRLFCAMKQNINNLKTAFITLSFSFLWTDQASVSAPISYFYFRSFYTRTIFCFSYVLLCASVCFCVLLCASVCFSVFAHFAHIALYLRVSHDVAMFFHPLKLITLFSVWIDCFAISNGGEARIGQFHVVCVFTVVSQSCLYFVHISVRGFMFHACFALQYCLIVMLFDATLPHVVWEQSCGANSVFVSRRSAQKKVIDLISQYTMWLLHL